MNPYVPGVTSSTKDNAKLLEKVKSDFKRTITQNKYQSKYQGINRLFFFSFEDKEQRKSYKRYYFPTVEIKNYNILIDGQNFLDQPVRNNLITYDSNSITAD